MINKRDSKGRISGGKSLYDWCVENNRNDILDSWDCDKNGITPHDISFSSSKDFYFKCSKGIHESELKKITYLTNSKRIKCIKCNSFAQHVIDVYGKEVLDRIWDKNNKYSMWEMPFKCNKEIVLYSYKTHKSYKTSASSFWDIKDIFEYEGFGNIKDEDTLAIKYPQSIDVWSDANLLTPYDYSYGSHDLGIWKCENNIHDEYIRDIKNSAIAGFKCPLCSQQKRTSALQDKVFNYLTNKLNYKVNTEFQCSLVPINSITGRKLPFDNEVEKLKLIIEVHGSQHYMVTGFSLLRAKETGNTPENEFKYRKKIDEFKKQYALNNGYFYLEIPYWSEDDESYKDLIDNKISEILKGVA